jgi:Lrp/AsnC family leucine-responsive transcriptional regulator
MDKFDLAILASLERDGRQSFVDLAEEVGLSKTPCWTRVQALEKNGTIRGYHADLAPQMLQLKLTAYIQVMINFGQRTQFEAAALANPAVLECMSLAGEADYLLKVVCEDVDKLDDLLRYNLSLLPGLQRSTTMICLKTIKSRASLTDAAGWRASAR